MRKLLSLMAISIGLASSPTIAQQAEVKLWRLDCGTVAANDLNAFSDTKAYTGKSKQLASSCYLIQHGSDYMLWDTGLPAAMKGKPLDSKAAMDATVTLTIKEQLATLNVDPPRSNMSRSAIIISTISASSPIFPARRCSSARTTGRW